MASSTRKISETLNGDDIDWVVLDFSKQPKPNFIGATFLSDSGIVFNYGHFSTQNEDDDWRERARSLGLHMPIKEASDKNNEQSKTTYAKSPEKNNEPEKLNVTVDSSYNDKSLDEFLNEQRKRYGITTGHSAASLVTIEESDHFKSLIENESNTHQTETKSCRNAKC